MSTMIGMVRETYIGARSAETTVARPTRNGDSECLTIQHPRGSIRMVTMTSDSLNNVESDRSYAEGLSNRDRIGTYTGESDGFFDVLAHPFFFLSAG